MNLELSAFYIISFGPLDGPWGRLVTQFRNEKADTRRWSNTAQARVRDAGAWRSQWTDSRPDALSSTQGQGQMERLGVCQASPQSIPDGRTDSSSLPAL